MPLAGYQPERRQIVLSGDNSFFVRGLSLTDLSVLIREHMPDMHAVFELFQSLDTLKPDELTPVVMSITSQAPGLAANVIALAAGEGDASDAARLPAPVQVQAILEIAHLTFTEVGGVGKAMEMIAALLKTTKLDKKLTTIKKARQQKAR